MGEVQGGEKGLLPKCYGSAANRQVYSRWGIYTGTYLLGGGLGDMELGGDYSKGLETGVYFMLKSSNIFKITFHHGPEGFFQNIYG